MLETLTKESFDPLKGDAFSLTHDGGTMLSLSLVAVLGTGLRGHASREQFAVHFLGPAMPVLPQARRRHHQGLRRFGLVDHDDASGSRPTSSSTRVASSRPRRSRPRWPATSDNHIYGSVPFGCADAPAPYTAVCNSQGQPHRSGTATKLNDRHPDRSPASSSSPVRS